jgi:hypothetical protein
MGCYLDTIWTRFQRLADFVGWKWDTNIDVGESFVYGKKDRQLFHPAATSRGEKLGQISTRAIAIDLIAEIAFGTLVQKN